MRSEGKLNFYILRWLGLRWFTLVRPGGSKLRGIIVGVWPNAPIISDGLTGKEEPIRHSHEPSSGTNSKEEERRLAPGAPRRTA